MRKSNQSATHHWTFWYRGRYSCMIASTINHWKCAQHLHILNKCLHLDFMTCFFAWPMTFVFPFKLILSDLNFFTICSILNSGKSQLENLKLKFTNLAWLHLSFCNKMLILSFKITTFFQRILETSMKRLPEIAAIITHRISSSFFEFLKLINSFMMSSSRGKSRTDISCIFAFSCGDDNSLFCRNE